MAFIAEDGTGLIDSTSYVTVAYADDYFTYINYQSSWFEKATIDRERSLMNGTQFLDAQYTFIGTKSAQTQNLEWPRTDAIDNNGFEITNIPKNLKQATCEAAFKTFAASLYTDTGVKGAVTKEKVDVIEIEYAAGTATTNPYTILDQLLFSAGLSLGNTGQKTTLKVVRV